jgi:hypothetical protein
MQAQFFAMLCGISMLTFSAVTKPSRATLLFWLGGVLCGVAFFDPALLRSSLVSLITLEPAQVSLLVALLGFSGLRKRRWSWAFPFTGGILAVIWAIALEAQAYPTLLAWLQVLVAAGVLFHAKRILPAFCPESLLREALVIVMADAFVIAIAPEILNGWRAALKFQDTQQPVLLHITAELLIPAAFGLIGVLYAVFKKQQSEKRWKSR